MFGELHTPCTLKEDLSLCRFRKRIDELQSIKRLHFRPYKTIHVFPVTAKSRPKVDPSFISVQWFFYTPYKCRYKAREVSGHVFVCQRSCICVLEVMYLCVRGHVFVCQRSCICVLEVMYLCVRGHVFMCWGIDLISFYDLSIGFWTCSDSVVFCSF